MTNKPIDPSAECKKCGKTYAEHEHEEGRSKWCTHRKDVLNVFTPCTVREEPAPVQEGRYDFVSLIQSFVHSRCDDHTPYRGPCVSCGYGRENPDLITDVDGLLEKVTTLQSETAAALQEANRQLQKALTISTPLAKELAKANAKLEEAYREIERLKDALKDFTTLASVFRDVRKPKGSRGAFLDDHRVNRNALELIKELESKLKHP